MKKAKLEYTDKGYSYIKCSKEDCLNWGGLAICDDCCEKLDKEVYLIYILHRSYCPKCFKEWQKRSHRYEEDIKMQEKWDKPFYQAYGFEVEQ